MTLEDTLPHFEWTIFDIHHIAYSAYLLLQAIFCGNTLPFTSQKLSPQNVKRGTSQMELREFRRVRNDIWRSNCPLHQSFPTHLLLCNSKRRCIAQRHSWRDAMQSPVLRYAPKQTHHFVKLNKEKYKSTVFPFSIPLNYSSLITQF